MLLSARASTELESCMLLPLTVASIQDNLEVVRLLVEARADTAAVQPADEITALMGAAVAGRVRTVQLLVTELGVDVNQENVEGETPLYLAAVRGQLNVVRLLVTKLGADVNHAKKDGATSLFIAAQLGHFELVRLLVADLGAEINKARMNSSTPVVIAAAMGHSKVVKWLTRHGADISPCEISDWPNNPPVLIKTAPHSVTSSAELKQWLESKSSCGNPDCTNSGGKRCARCRKVRYCSKQCQVAHHPTHKLTCPEYIVVEGV